MINFEVERIIDFNDNTTGVVISFSKDVIPQGLRELLEIIGFTVYIAHESGETKGVWSSKAYQVKNINHLITEYNGIKATIDKYHGDIPDFDTLKVITIS